jgi:hypothetical protein
MVDHSGGFEPIMAIEFLHVARPQEEVLKEIAAMKPPGAEAPIPIHTNATDNVPAAEEI